MVYLENTLAFDDSRQPVPAKLERALDLVQHHSLGEHPVAIENNRLVLRFFKCRLSSQFTPADTAGDVTHVTTCASLPTGHAIPFSALQTLAMTEGGLLRLERLCHLAHVVNHFIASGNTGPLSLPLNARLANQGISSHDQRFLSVLEKLGIEPARLRVTLPAKLEPVIEAMLTEHYQRVGIPFTPNEPR
ncbi:hypothetical protein [Paludibacterium paludis]|uniref:Uncharacterized protein n=1 Tax=Paludibacterium paludis TaxID=1225769 RepID=A0A918P6C9_9NEIS|nr:hypothetical protein [Paludibacterium paludis]GGY25309.1 hypothetical protein GCM10011289_31110 [Paludibacterium paludis]